MNSDITFCEQLKKDNIDTWTSILKHRFIIEISNGTLPTTKFIFYLKQDKIFLRIYLDLLGNTSIDSSDDRKDLFKDIIDSTRCEMIMQGQVLEKLQVDPVNINEVPIQNITEKYILHLRNISRFKDLDLIVCAIAPCIWTYYEISRMLVMHKIEYEPYREWSQFYSSKDSHKQIVTIIEKLNESALNAEEKKKSDMSNFFSQSCKYELEFWNMAYFH